MGYDKTQENNFSQGLRVVRFKLVDKFVPQPQKNWWSILIPKLLSK